MTEQELKHQVIEVIDKVFETLKLRKTKKNYIFRYMNSVLRKVESGNVRESQLDLIRFQYLLKHLSEISDFSSDLISQFSKEFRRSGQESQYCGVRFEAYVAASLIRKGINFQKSEAPDFVLPDYDIGIECTSVRVLNNDSKKDLSYKIASALNKKSKSGSHAKNTIVFIDVTNLVYNSHLPNLNNLRPTVQECFNSTEFASVVLFMSHYNHDLSRYETNIIREDNKSAPREVVDFLDKFYPIRDHVVYNSELVPEG